MPDLNDALQMVLAALPQWASVLAAFAALATLAKALHEYMRQNALKRFEAFQAMLKRFDARQDFRELAEMCARNDPALLTYNTWSKIDYAGFFEELALMHNSGLLRAEVAKVMFGPWIDECDRATNFWSGSFDRSHFFWRAFSGFAERLRSVEGDPEKFRF